MAKSKPKQPPNKKCTSGGPETLLHEEDSWVIVKKQKITILIPRLPVTKHSATPNLRGSPSPPVATAEVGHITTQQADPPVAMGKSMPLPTEEAITTLSSPPKLDHRAISGNPRNGDLNFHKTLGVCSALKARKRCGSLLADHALVNAKMRALNLERKLQRAGGLNSWLVSLGLSQFVKLFRCKRVGKFQLVNLTMKKLKDMGADAVGPRRKLMHAIDCLW